MKTPQPLGNQFQGSKTTLTMKNFLLWNSLDAVCDIASSPFAVLVWKEPGPLFRLQDPADSSLAFSSPH